MQTDEEVVAGYVRSHYPGPGSTRERVAAGRTRASISAGVAYVVAYVAVQLLDLGHRRQSRWATGLAPWLHALATVLVVLGAVVVVGCLAYACASTRARAERRSPLWALTPRQRRHVRRQALGQQPCQPGDVPFLRVLATRWSRPDHVAGLAAGAVPLFAGLSVLSSPPLRALAGLVAASQAIGLVVLLRRTVLARRFLSSHAPRQRAAR